MSELGKRITSRLIAIDEKPVDLARSTKSSRATVSDWISGKTKEIKGERLILASKFLNCQPSWLATGKGDMTSNVEHVDIKPRNVPIISYVRAGEWEEAVDLYAPGYADEYTARVVDGDNIYALKVIGDSMTAQSGISFPEGYIIHVKPQRDAENGDCIIAKIKGNDKVTFKQLKYNEDTPYLNPLNSKHEPIFDEFKIIGKVVAAMIQF